MRIFSGFCFFVDDTLDHWEKVQVNDYGYLNIGDNVTMVHQDDWYQKEWNFGKICSCFTNNESLFYCLILMT